MNVKLALDIEITTYCMLLEGKESQLESGMQNLCIHTKITSSYSGGLSSAYGNLMCSCLIHGLSSFQSSFSSVRGSSPFSCVSSSEAVVVKKVETLYGKLQVVQCPIQVNNHCGPF